MLKDYHLLKQTLPFWQHLNQNEKNILINNASIIEYQSGQLIHHGKNDCVGILIIVSGKLRTYMISNEGKEITLFYLQPHNVCVLSAACILDSIDFEVLVEAKTTCQIIQISSAAFLQLSKQNIYVELFSYKLATERFSDVMWAMQQLLFMSFDQRLAAYLIEASDRTNSLDIKITHEQIAQDLNSAREVVSRMLKHFAKEGYVHLSRGKIHLINKQALASLK
ncbi:Crp/Fnr family transcriptional regulator [Erysipelatoclostridium sp. An15]|uniref:Crp/Fnr family transcriptional regulator n=1 Tax=unclassified Thomasclavelia TaxID=3025756 RepID=UPI000B37A913|nr:MULTISPECIES: Crp/Fnr family transcriptional regulator [unclassified Thomasclavelia]OUP74826.1 Crp/Fnr family transcriptional regulator [Erysipelatoclostridium sp. An173]OUQ05188.1 Crp/Fnr family transcriptional regulator [Erysipelatoclostridium sp. An15]